MRIALLGRTRMLYDCIEKVIENGDEIVLIGTCTAAPEYDIREQDFEDKAHEIGACFFNDIEINSPQIVSIMKSVGAELAISINWLTIIKQDAISCFKYGILNAHCGDLPKYRGNATPNWSILNGETSYTISIHYMAPGELDSGDVILKKRYPINTDTTITDIYRTMDDEIPTLFCEAINQIRRGNYKGESQSREPSDAMRCYPRIPSDSFIDWNDSCENIMRNIRASTHPFQGAFCFWNDIKIYFFEARTKEFSIPCCVYPGQVILVDKLSGDVHVAASDGIIVLNKIWICNEEHKAADILKSVRIRLNYCISEEIYLLKQQVKLLMKEIEELRGKNV